MTKTTKPGVINPFTGKQTQRKHDIRGDRWKAVDDDISRYQRPGPSKPVQYVVVENSQVPSYIASLSDNVGDRGNDASDHPLSQAAIYNPLEIPDPNLRPPSTDSWEDEYALYADSPTIPPGEQVRFARSPRQVSPLSHRLPAGRDSTVSDIIPLGWSHIRTEPASVLASDPNATPITAFPSFPHSSPKPTRKSTRIPTRKKSGKKVKFPKTSAPLTTYAVKEEERNCLAGFYSSAREIYRAGPKGEGQKIWGGLRRLRKERRAKKQATRQREQFRVEKPKTPEPAPVPRPERPYPRLPSGINRVYDLSPVRDTALNSPSVYSTCEEVRGKDKVRPPKETGRSTHPCSFEAPLGASASVQYDAREIRVDTSKPLPSLPRLQPAPRSRKQRPLPKTPPPPRPPAKSLQTPPLPPKAPQRPVSVSFAVPEPRPRRFVTLEDMQCQKPNRREPKQNNNNHEARSSRWFTRAGSKLLNVKTSAIAHEDMVTNQDAMERQGKFKSKISLPGPMMATDARSANIAAESGGVGGAAAAVSLPIRHGRGNALGWSSKEGKKDKGKEKKKEAPPRPKPPAEGLAPKKHPWQEFIGSPTHIMEDAGVPDSEQGYEAPPMDSYPSQSQSQGQGRQPPRERAPPRAARVRDLESSTRVQSHRRFEFEDGSLTPVPLFSGNRAGTKNGGGEAKGNKAIRNTRFYQPYDDVLHEYQG